MSGSEEPLEGSIAIVTGAGQGIGRAHALYLARAGAAVVVNDLAIGEDGRSLAAAVADEIIAAGGRATFAHDSIASWAGAERVVATAVDTFGDLTTVVNNAGGPRHHALLDMPEETWDLVIDVNLKGTFAMTRAAGRYWRSRHEAGNEVVAAIVNTTSRAGLFPGSAAINGKNAGMSNYGSAKAGVIALTEIAARELAWLGVRVNCISPSARTRLTAHGALADLVAAPDDDTFDAWDPANISPVVGWLGAPSCPMTGQVYWVFGGDVNAIQAPRVIETISRDAAWTPALLDEQLPWFEAVAARRYDFPES